MRFFSHRWPIVLILLILVLGGFFRLWMLADVPPGLYPDEAKNANDAVTTLETGEYRVFYPENNGREGLHIWLTAIAYQYFGVNTLALKLVVALAGLFTILGTYLLTRETLLLAGRHAIVPSRLKTQNLAVEATALLSAGLIATSFWHIAFSRIAFRAIFTPLLIAFGLWLLFLGLRKKSFWVLAISGVIWGLGLYTYIAFRFAILIPAFTLSAAFFISAWSNMRHRTSGDGWLRGLFVKDGWWKAAGFLGAFGATIFGIVRYFIQNPQDFIGRATGISVFDSATPIASFFTSLGVHLQMLFFQGDHNWRHNFSGEAQLMLPVALLLLIGVAYSLLVLRDSIREKNKSGFLAHITLAFGFGVMLLPAALTTQGIPHALRAIGLMPFVFIYAAFGLLFFVDILFPHRRHRKEIWPFGLGVAVLIVLLLASFQFSHYFQEWGEKEEVKNAFSHDFVAIGEYFNTVAQQSNETHKFLVVNASGVEISYPESILSAENESGQLPMPAQTPLFIQRTHTRPVANTTYVRPSELPLSVSGSAVFVPLIPSEEIKQRLRVQYPLGAAVQFEDLWAYLVETR